jgi:hypothetical protein
MSERKDYGDPAFPGNGSREWQFEHSGMWLRDWFAGQALAGILASEPEDVAYATNVAAERAYRFADAMLAERSK